MLRRMNALSRNMTVALLVFSALAAMASGADVLVTSPDSESAYHAGDEVNVQWSYEDGGENIEILLLNADEQVADLCEAETDGVCYDLTQDNTVVLPSTGLDSGSDYTITVTDVASGDTGQSDPFAIISDTSHNIEITSPDGTEAFEAGDVVTVEWLHVGTQSLFDIYIRQGEDLDNVRVSANLCAGEADGSCTGSNIGSASVTVPAELEEGDDYRFLVVAKNYDSAYDMSNTFSVGMSSTSSAAGTIGIVIGTSVGGVCLLALVLILFRKRTRKIRRDEKMATMDILSKRRSAPAVSLAVEDMQILASPATLDGRQESSRNFINPIYSNSQNFYEGQLTPPPDDGSLWRRSRDVGRFVGKHISRSFSRSQGEMGE